MSQKIEIPKISYDTAVLTNEIFNHFGIHPSTTQLYGDRVEDILDVELTLGLDQERPLPNSECWEPDYWGWFDYNKNEFTMVYAQYFLLNMCFPSGIKIAEQCGRGEAYRLNVKIK